MAKFSTGLRNKMLSTNSFRSLMDGKKLLIYSGPVPATADAALGAATLLCTISESGSATGLTFAATASSGTIGKTGTETWSGINAVSGTASFFRFVDPADTTDASTAVVRLQGTIGQIATDMLVADPVLVATEPFTLNYFNVALPTA